jgi:DNA-binding NarL/FixJ family response regulator
VPNRNSRNAPSEDATQSDAAPIRLVITDRHVLVLKGLEALLATERSLQVVAACTSGEQTLEAVRKHRPDVVVMDVRMRGLDGLAVLSALNQEGVSVPVVLLAAEIDDNQTLEAVRLGARGIVLKEMTPALLMECIRAVHAGELWVERERVARALSALLRREAGVRELPSGLTNRELDVVRMVLLGLRNAEMAAKLCVSQSTVQSHLHHIYEKLGVDSRIGLLLLVQREGFK